MDCAKTDNLRLRPGRCAFCPNIRVDEGFIDCRKDFDGHGRAYICAHCIITFCTKLGFPTPVTYNELQEERDALKSQVDELTNNLDQAILDSFERLSSRVHSSIVKNLEKKVGEK